MLTALLLAAIFYGIKLHRQIKQLRTDKAQLNYTLKKFIQENNRAQDSILQMRENAAETISQIEALASDGAKLKHSLAHLIDDGHDIYRKLEGQNKHKMAALNAASNFNHVKGNPLRRTSPPLAPNASSAHRVNKYAPDAQQLNHHTQALGHQANISPRHYGSKQALRADIGVSSEHARKRSALFNDLSNM
ncbi:MAG: DUF6468 domain-containing protein [Alphaproteobacteria bacterium]